MFIQFASKQSENDEETKSKDDIKTNDKKDISLASFKENIKTEDASAKSVLENKVEDQPVVSNTTHEGQEFANPIIFANRNDSETNRVLNSLSNPEGEVELVEVIRPGRRSAIENIVDNTAQRIEV